jgi:tetratricopeptide (TPR) repeat protein
MAPVVAATVSSVDQYKSLVIDALWRLGISPLATVAEADLYLDIFENQPAHSLEIAQQRGIPTWLFISNGSHPEGHSFTSDTHLLELIFRAAQTVHRPMAAQDQAAKATMQPADVHLNAIPEPPAPYIAHPYLLTRQFFGRAAEIDLLNNWARSKQGMLIVEAIGGMGKSALTWEWTQQHAHQQISDLAGVLWWSFYEGDATVSNFLRHVLIYATRRSAADIDALKFDVRLDLLRQQLRERPFLLILDGLERILTAYHRLDAPHLLDEQVSAMQKDNQLRSCIDPRHANLLKILSECYPSKVLISTRLMPSDLQDTTGAVLRGIEHHNLTGLLDVDVFHMIEHYGVHGEPKTLNAYAKLIDNHSLLVGMLAARIHEDASGDFGRWMDQQGHALALEEGNLAERRGKVLEYVLSGLPHEQRKLIGQFAAFRYPVAHHAIATLNPYVAAPPPKPPFVDAYEQQMKRYQSFLEQKPEAHEYSLKRYLEDNRPAYEMYQVAIQAYENAPETCLGRVKLHCTLLDLERLGLLSWNRPSNRFDLHPVIRAYALEVLPHDEKITTYQKISDYFQGIPAEDLSHVADIGDLRRSIEIYHALLNAEMLEEASRFYGGQWSRVLEYQLEAFYLIIELVKPLFKNGEDQPPPLIEPQARIYNLSNAYYHLGYSRKALGLADLRLKINIDRKNVGLVCTSLFDLGNSLRSDLKLAQAHRAALLELELALADQDKTDIAMAWLSLLKVYCDAGAVERARDAYRNYVAAPRTHNILFWQAEVDWHFAKLLHSHGENARALAELALLEAQAANNALVIRTLHYLLGEIALDENKLEEAEHYFNEHIVLAKKAGLRGDDGYAGLARVCLVQGRLDDAYQLAQLGMSNVDAAVVYEALGKRGDATAIALSIYRRSWVDGPPYAYLEKLQAASELLGKLFVQRPTLPHFDPAKIGSIPYEQEIRALIRETGREQRKHRLTFDIFQAYQKAITNTLTEFAGHPVQLWQADQASDDLDSVCYWIGLCSDELSTEVHWTDKFADFLNTSGAEKCQSLVVGNWERPWERESAERVVQALVVAAPRLPHLKAIFLGIPADHDEHDETWIQYGDISPLFEAYPRLEQFAVRGTNGLILGRVQHEYLKALVIQTPGFPRELLQEINNAQLPSLERLELWLGSRAYGATVIIDDLRSLIVNRHFPTLRHLGLRNTELTDEIAELLAKSEILVQLETLDLSLGILSDTGAQALLDARALHSLAKLDIHHHYCSIETIARFKQLPVLIDLADSREDKIVTANLEDHQLLTMEVKPHWYAPIVPTLTALRKTFFAFLRRIST